MTSLDRFLPDTLARKLHTYGRKLWVRVVFMGLLAFVVLGLTQIVERYVPDPLRGQLPGAGADRLLQIIANAMLAVTTFSLTVMVTVYRSSSDQFTPRVHRLIIEDPVTQKTLAAFIGAYVYALVAIILRELGVYVDDRALVLFVMTVLVLAFIVFNLIRWVLHLQTFGSLIDTTRQVEQIARVQFQERLNKPCLGACPFTGEVPEVAKAFLARESGYIQHIYPEALQDVAKRVGVVFYLPHGIGSFVFLNEPLLQVVCDGEVPDWAALGDAISEAVILGDVRTYDQDPRFGLMVMGEIASKALSPGVNDPGTAIDVITRAGRMLSLYKDETDDGEAVLYDRLHVRPLQAADLIEDAFGALARDGAGTVEVQQRLQATLAALMKHPDAGLSRAAEDAAVVELARALQNLRFGPDKDRLAGAVDPGILKRARDTYGV